MEEYIIIIAWLVVVGVTTVIPAILKARREAEAKRAKGTHGHQATERSSAPRAQHGQLQPESDLTATSSIQENSLQSTFTPLEEETSFSEVAEADTMANETEAIDFDLRKAVIYSEILKPKFDE